MPATLDAVCFRIQEEGDKKFGRRIDVKGRTDVGFRSSFQTPEKIYSHNWLSPKQVPFIHSFSGETGAKKQSR